MKRRTTHAVTLGLVALSFAVTAALYHRLPDPVPVHWDVTGTADGFAPKPWGPFLLPLVAAGAHSILRLAARRADVGRLGRAWAIIQVAIAGFLFIVNGLVLLAGLGAPVAMDRALAIGLGLLFVVLGNYLGKLTRNPVVGIRTPWTMASDEVWLRTQRLGGKVLVLTGLAFVVAALLGAGIVAVLAGTIAAAAVPVIYSYVLYRRIGGGAAAR
jgi:uncharacterized membrane protein